MIRHPYARGNRGRIEDIREEMKRRMLARGEIGSYRIRGTSTFADQARRGRWWLGKTTLGSGGGCDL